MSNSKLMWKPVLIRAGIPSSRMLVLGGITDQGFKFFTSYDSPKAKDMVRLNVFFTVFEI